MFILLSQHWLVALILMKTTLWRHFTGLLNLQVNVEKQKLDPADLRTVCVTLRCDTGLHYRCSLKHVQTNTEKHANSVCSHVRSFKIVRPAFCGRGLSWCLSGWSCLRQVEVWDLLLMSAFTASAVCLGAMLKPPSPGGMAGWIQIRWCFLCS